MDNSVSTNQQTLMRWRNSQVSFNQSSQLASFQLPSTNQADTGTSIEQLKAEQKISKIAPEEVAELFGKIKTDVKKSLEESNADNKPLTAFDYLERNIKEIEHYDIEVKINSEEIRTAILYSSLGINFLDIKRLEMRMELYEVAKKEVEASAESQAINKEQAQELMQVIEQKMASLQAQKQSLLDRSGLKRNEDDLLEKVKLHNALNASTEVK